MELKPGYKLTEVGVIPEEWEVRELRDFARIITGPFGTLLKASEYSGSDGIPLISVGEVGDGRFQISERTPRVPEQVVNRLPQYLLREGDIVFGRKGAVDRSALVSKKEQGWFLGSDGISVRPAGGYHPPYLAAQFRSEDTKAWLIQNAIGTTMASLNQGVLGRVKIPVPPLPEQSIIAEALSDVDALLSGLDVLIAKKRDLKQAAMEQLLTGKTRLPGFEGDWEMKRLGELGYFLKGSGVRKDQSMSGNLPCVRYGEIYTHHRDVICEFYSWISQEVAETATLLIKGDLLFAGSGETKEEIGKCVAFVGDHEAYTGGDTIILRPKNCDPVFLGYYLNHPQIQRQKSSKGQGDAVVHIGAQALSGIVLKLPEFSEQSAIAQILSDMDAELVALEARREKTRLLKQGMMQELLTGRTRLVLASPAENAAKPAVDESASIKQSPLGAPHSWAINEAVVVAVLVKNFGSEQFPLGRKRCTKLAYLMHRHVEHSAQGYLKKAAGPYNPEVKYKGPEGIAQKNGYIRAHSLGTYSGFVAADRIAQAEAYFDKWYGQDVLGWLNRFRFEKNDELELLTTVDMAVQDLKRQDASVTVEGVKTVIRSHPEWKPKLDRETFSDVNIGRAIGLVGALFPES